MAYSRVDFACSARGDSTTCERSLACAPATSRRHSARYVRAPRLRAKARTPNPCGAFVRVSLIAQAREASRARISVNVMPWRLYANRGDGARAVHSRKARGTRASERARVESARSHCARLLTFPCCCRGVCPRSMIYLHAKGIPKGGGARNPVNPT